MITEQAREQGQDTSKAETWPATLRSINTDKGIYSFQEEGGQNRLAFGKLLGGETPGIGQSGVITVADTSFTFEWKTGTPPQVHSARFTRGVGADSDEERKMLAIYPTNVSYIQYPNGELLFAFEPSDPYKAIALAFKPRS